MAPIKVHGAVYSTATQRVLACLHEKELDFEFVPIDMFAEEHKKEPFISSNPFGQVPTFEDGDLNLFAGASLVYKGPKMPHLLVLMEVESLKYDQAGSSLVFEIKIKPMRGMTTDPEAVAKYVEKLATILDVYEARLTKSKYIGGDTFTLADLHHLPVIQVLMDIKVKQLFDGRPFVSAWCADILARPAWLKVVAMK